MKKFITAVIGLLLLQAFIFGAAAVKTTKQPTEGTDIYVAGNPDMYPFEYYDDKKEEYIGIVPDMFEKLSESTGYGFTYVSAGKENEQERLAKNSQVEIVSVHEKGAAGDDTDDFLITSYDRNGEKKELYIGFTDIASEELVNAVTSAMKNFTAEDILLYSADLKGSATPEGSIYYTLFIWAAAIAVLLTAVLIFILFRRKKEKEALSETLYDPLTGIANGKCFSQWYSSFISPASAPLYYIAYIAIEVNKILRYSDDKESENIQIYAAYELSSVSKETDLCARIHDGVFAFAFQAANMTESEEKIKDIMAKLNGFSSDTMYNYNIKFHCGVYHLAGPNILYEKALFNAHQGYFYAVENGIDYKFTDEKLLNHANYVEKLQKRLWKAMENEEFVLYLQYIFDGKGEKVIGAEALSRWYSQENGLIYPKDYLAFLEEADMISRLDMYMLEMCCRRLQSWKDTNKKNLKLACNMSRITLSENGYCDNFIEIVSKYDFEPDKLVIEITEDALVYNNTAILESISKCKEFGCTIVLDDFGAGYSSMQDIAKFPVDTIKIDGKLIINIKEEKGRMLINALVKFSHSLNIKALCEGVETEEELKFAVESGCDFIQGFALARTIPADETSAERGLEFI